MCKRLDEILIDITETKQQAKDLKRALVTAMKEELLEEGKLKFTDFFTMKVVDNNRPNAKYKKRVKTYLHKKFKEELK